jgi:hypothetical protein
LNLSLARELDSKKSEKRNISNDIARVRAELSVAMDEICGKTSMEADIQSYVNFEDARMENLREQLIESMREVFQ